jgi:hypothetical protein
MSKNDPPSLIWPTLSSQVERLVWYRAVIEAYSSVWGNVELTPVAESDLSALEDRLGCLLPSALRTYHLELGALSLAETLCSVTAGNTPIQPLPDAYPGIVDIAESEADIMILAENLIVFGDYLGNGNMFCFHRQTGEVYYFDHDTAPTFTRFFSSPQEYLDALMILCLAEVYEDDEGAEAILIQRFGESLIEKWRY